MNAFRIFSQNTPRSATPPHAMANHASEPKQEKSSRAASAPAQIPRTPRPAAPRPSKPSEAKTAAPKRTAALDKDLVEKVRQRNARFEGVAGPFRELRLIEPRELEAIRRLYMLTEPGHRVCVEVVDRALQPLDFTFKLLKLLGVVDIANQGSNDGVWRGYAFTVPATESVIDENTQAFGQRVAQYSEVRALLGELPPELDTLQRMLVTRLLRAEPGDVIAGVLESRRVRFPQEVCALLTALGAREVTIEDAGNGTGLHKRYRFTITY